MARHVELVLANVDVRELDCDLLILKHAQGSYGADAAVREALSNSSREAPEEIEVGDSYEIKFGNHAPIRARRVLFVGVPPLSELRYREIQEIGRVGLSIAAHSVDKTGGIGLTLHGPGFGLDEEESAISLLRGLVAAFRSENIPAGLERVTIAEIDTGRIKRLRPVLSQVLESLGCLIAGDGTAKSPWLVAIGSTPATSISERRALGATEFPPPEKPHIFVAMPFEPSFDDVFFYGIQRPVKSLGMNCERIDQTQFTGDIVSRIKQRIDTCVAVVAELSTANPNVYLEVGYAWGRGKPTILIVRSATELKFDVKGQRCLLYSRIQDLEKQLETALAELQMRT